MFEVRRHAVFTAWMDGLRDVRSQAVVARRITRLERGLFGDVKAVGDGVRELRIDYGPGFRVYFVQRGTTIVVLLCGGDKSSQKADIAQARRLALEV